MFFHTLEAIFGPQIRLEGSPDFSIFDQGGLPILRSMKKITSEFSYELYGSVNELAEEDRMLLNHARNVAVTAYAPYSNFHVGAAVLMENGEVIKGSNQENAVYPSGLCAERVALFAAAAQYPGIRIRSIAVTAQYDDQNTVLPVSPCGDCRQVMVEYEHRYRSDIRLIMTATEGRIIVISCIRTLLPLLFNAENLKK